MIAPQQQLIRRSISGNNNEDIEMTSLNTDVTTNGSQESLTNSNNQQSSAPSTPLSDISNDTNPLANTTATDLNGSVTDVRKSVEKSQKKKKSNNSWLNILNPTYKSRHDEFRRLFSNLVPNNERLVVDYSCALQKEILVHGRLYISLNYISFYANIFKWETTLVIKCRDITSVTKANTARVIPNAIQVVTNSGDKNVLTSFAARDKTYVMLFRIWQNALLDQPMSSAQLWQWVHYSYGEDLGLTSDDDEEYYSDNLVTTVPTQPPLTHTDNSDSNTSIEAELNAERENLDQIIDPKSNCAKCRCDSHDGKLIINETFSAPIDRIFELLFTDSKFIHNLHKSRKTYDLKVTQWDDSNNKDNKDKVRQLNYTVALNHALVKSARTVECQRLIGSSAGIYYTIKSEAANEGVPYCDTFSMHSLYCLTSETQNMTKVKVYSNVIFKKNVWGLSLMKSTIEKNSFQGITDFCADVTKQLPQWIKMENNLGITNHLNDLKIDANNISFMTVDSTGSSIENSIASIGQVVDSPSNTATNYLFFSNIYSISNTTVLRIIIIALIFSLLLNAIILFKIWTINSIISYTEPLDVTQISKDPFKALSETIDYLLSL
ncbi:protein Aster-C-like [Oppia nitens]|uniref:protein Aster-C-like n=1 Tax=Oppia nitens TaxID=1686743 RepID=UPI0023DAAD1B|nr:protein Aster-C-like [Oppia nitens]